MTANQRTYIVRKGQDAELANVSVTSLEINGQEILATSFLAGVGEVVDLNGEADALIMDAAQAVRLDGSSAGKVRIKISGAYDFEFSANTFAALLGSSILTDVINETTTDAGVTIEGILALDNTLSALREALLTKAVNYPLVAADSGVTVFVTAADKVLTLPSTVAGLKYRVILTAAGLSAAAGLAISPAAADKIMGNGLTSADNKDLILTGATDREGDMVELLGDGVDGWYITSILGTWARE